MKHTVDVINKTEDHLFLWDGVRENIRTVMEQARRGYIGGVFENESSWIGMNLKTWDQVSQAVDAIWEEGVQIVSDMLKKLGKVKLPRPQQLRVKPTFRDDDGSEVDLDRYQSGRPFWRTVTKAPRTGPRVITLIVQIDGSCYRKSVDLLWRGAACLCMGKILEDSGYRCEIISIDYLQGGLSRKKDQTLHNSSSACWIKKAGGKFNVPTLINAISGWYFRTVSFGVRHLLDEFQALMHYGYPRPVPQHLLARVSKGVAEPWLISGLWNEKESIEFCQKNLAILCDPPKTKRA